MSSCTNNAPIAEVISRGWKKQVVAVADVAVRCRGSWCLGELLLDAGEEQIVLVLGALGSVGGMCCGINSCYYVGN